MKKINCYRMVDDQFFTSISREVLFSDLYRRYGRKLQEEQVLKETVDDAKNHDEGSKILQVSGYTMTPEEYGEIVKVLGRLKPYMTPREMESIKKIFWDDDK